MTVALSMFGVLSANNAGLALDNLSQICCACACDGKAPNCTWYMPGAAVAEESAVVALGGTATGGAITAGDGVFAALDDVSGGGAVMSATSEAEGAAGGAAGDVIVVDVLVFVDVSDGAICAGVADDGGVGGVAVGGVTVAALGAGVVSVVVVTAVVGTCGVVGGAGGSEAGNGCWASAMMALKPSMALSTSLGGKSMLSTCRASAI